MEVSKGNRIHIGIFGKVNSGKSSLINLLADREVSIVSDREGTTTDSVYKSMEFLGLGPVTIMDTPGVCDKSFLGKLREQRLERDIEKADIAIILFSRFGLNGQFLFFFHFQSDSECFGYNQATESQ